MVVRPRSNVFSSPETACLFSDPTYLAVTGKICSSKAKLAFRNILLTEAFVLLRCYAFYFGVVYGPVVQPICTILGSQSLKGKIFTA